MMKFSMLFEHGSLPPTSLTIHTYLALHHTECSDNKALQVLLAYQVYGVLPNLLDPTRGPVLVAHILDDERIKYT